MQPSSPCPSSSLAPDPMRTRVVVEAARKPKPAPDLTAWFAATHPDQVPGLPERTPHLFIRVDGTHEQPIVVADERRELARFTRASDAALFLDAHRRLMLVKPWHCYLPRAVTQMLARLGVGT